MATKGLEGPMDWITLKRAEEISGVSAATLRNQVMRGRLRVKKIGPVNVTTRLWLHQYLTGRSTQHGKANPLPAGYVAPGDEDV